MWLFRTRFIFVALLAFLLASVVDRAWAGQTLSTTQTPSAINGTHGGSDYEEDQHDGRRGIDDRHIDSDHEDSDHERDESHDSDKHLVKKPRGSNSLVLSTISLNPSSVTGGSFSIGTVTLTSSAPGGGAVVILSSNNAAATVPASVTVAAGLTTGTFTVNTSAVGAATPASISGSYNGSKSAALIVNAPVLSMISLNPSFVTGGAASTGTAILTGPAPAGGAVVALSAIRPIVAGIQGVHSPVDLPQGGSVDWASLGPAYSSIPSGTVAPVTGLPGSNVALSTATGLPMTTLTNCSFGGDCGWYGNFAVGAGVLWMGGTYNGDTGWWATNGPLTVRFDRPQRGIGFQAMADESGPFTATLCAYDSSNTLLGCIPFSGNGTGTADGSAVFVGLYDDMQEISKVTIDAGGALYPHDFAIGRINVASTQRQLVPASVTVPAGATGVTFPVNTSAVTSTMSVNITGSYVMTQSASLSINPPVLSAISLNPASVIGGASSTGTATLSGPAPVGGVAVTLSGINPIFTGIQGVHSPVALPHDGSVTWTDLGPSFTSVPSGTVASITGLAGSNVTLSTASGLPAMILTNCPAVANCGWSGNFTPGAPLLRVSGNYDGNGSWLANGPLTLTLNTAQRGVAFAVMADEVGSFTGNLCAYNGAGALLGCVPFSGAGAPLAGGTNGMAAYVGLYDDIAEVSSVTIDAGGVLRPHDFAIGTINVASTQRQLVPASVTLPAGATSATFAVTANSVTASTSVNISGSYSGLRTATLNIHP